MLTRRVNRLWRAILGEKMTELEADHASAVLDHEREQLRSKVAEYNRGLAGHAGLIQRLKSEVGRLAAEREALEPRLRARLEAGDREAAGRLALRLEALKRSIDECRLEEALAELTELASGLQGAIGAADPTLDRVKERLDERRHYAAGRVRVARESLGTEDLRERDAEQAHLAEQALARFEAREP